MFSGIASWFGKLFADSIVSRFLDAILTWWRERQARSDAMARTAAEQREAALKVALEARERMAKADEKPVTQETVKGALDAGRF